MQNLSYSVQVPKVTFETRTWEPTYPELYSHREVERQTGEYASAVVPSIAKLNLNIGQELASDIEDATLKLHDFDYYALTRLGADSPALGPMSSILLRTESTSSSQIEQLTTSAKQLALAELGAGAKANALTVVGNVRAMEAALRLSDELETSSILAMQHELLSRQAGMEQHAGTFRNELVWIGGNDNAGPIGSAYIAPQHELVPAAIEDLVLFMNRADIAALIQIAIAHAQFETIHPFADGNGRTGRALAQSMIRNKGLATHTTVPISAGILTNTDRYFEALTLYRCGDAAPIIHLFADAARYASFTGKTLVDNLSQQLEISREKLAGTRPESITWKVLPLLISQPVINTNFLTQTLEINNATAIRTLDTLTSRGILVERTGQARNRIWEHRGILGALDDYAKGLKRVPNRAI